jgi:hypothetical protein
MRVISESPFVTKRIIAPFLFVVVVTGVIALLFAPDMVDALNSPPMRNQDIPLLMRLLGGLPPVTVVTYMLASALSLADEVRDAGDALIVRKSGHEARIPLADIASITHVPLWWFWSYQKNSSVLTLRTPYRFGSKVRFMSIMSGFVTRQKPDAAIYDALVIRINDARRQALRSSAALTAPAR